MHILQFPQAVRVIGIELRTSNEQAMQTIPAHWQRFASEGVAQQVPGRLCDEVYAVYTHFEDAGRSNRGLYSLVIGVPVPADEPVPAGLAHVVIPASRRAVFPVPQGRIDQVPVVWQDIWAHTALPKTFWADHEHYHAGGIDILIGLAPVHTTPAMPPTP